MVVEHLVSMGVKLIYMDLEHLVDKDMKVVEQFISMGVELFVSLGAEHLVLWV